MKKRLYKQNCSLAFASDLLGERWTLLLFRELLIQPCRFKELNTYLQGMGTNLLTNRLKELEQDGLIEKEDPENKRSAYQLSPMGLQVEPSVLALIRWGYQNGRTQDDYLHFEHWDLLAMKAFFSKKKGKKAVVLQFSSSSLTAWVSVSKKGFSFALGTDKAADVIIKSNIQLFQQSISNGEFIENTKISEFVEWFELPI